MMPTRPDYTRPDYPIGRWLFALLLFIMTASAAQAAELLLEFDSPEQRARYEHLLREYRCLKCQNQNLADSNAALAGDLRDEIYRQVVAEAPRDEIDEYLVSRYGEFVRYRPRLTASTLVLWLGPFLLLLVVVAGVLRMLRRHRATHEPLSAEEQERLERARRLLDKSR